MNKAILSLNFMYSMERFATAIYRVQKGGFKEAFISQKMNFAVDNEWQHASKLKKRITELNSKPTGISVLFQMAGSTLGSISRCFGKPLALKTDLVIEKRAVKDYTYFMNTLSLDDQTKLMIKSIIADEESHIKNWQDSIKILKDKISDNL
jgi:demethoxyubiquinone hydroxylase (CLK1/Coq7/Cat5 family)